jgi:hypothetical protein
MGCVRTQGCLPQSPRPVGCLSLRRAYTSVLDTEGSCRVCVSFNTAAVLLWSPGAQVQCVHKDWVCTSHLWNRNGIAGERSLLRSDNKKTCPNVADDSSLRQAIDVETKRNAGLSRSVTKPDAETSHAPTLQDNSGVPQAVIPLFKVRERSVTLGKCG